MIIRHIVFDIDGTLIDTEKAVLKSLQDTIFEVTKSKIETNDLKFALGIPGEVTLKRLGIQNVGENGHLDHPSPELSDHLPARAK